MTGPGWLTCSSAEVPAGDRWLGPGEREVLEGLHVAKRREDWLLGRWAAKLAVAAWTGAAPEAVEVVAAGDGAPEARVDGEPAALSLSLSHRGGRALAAVAGEGAAVGCDLELVEPRSDAFVREWLSPPEQAVVAAAGPERALAANLLWTAKEAAAKLRREGLRLDVRQAVAEPGSLVAAGCGWHALRVAWDGLAIEGWWRSEPGWVMALVADPVRGEPRALAP